MNFCELFKSIQGEGFFSGQPSIFARVSGCNLKCCFSGGSICDTAYTSFNPELSTFTENDLFELINNNPQIHHIVFTGGEPLLYRDELDELVGQIYEANEDMVITIETNGTFEPLEHEIDLYSISPKLSTSVPSKPCEIKIDEDTTFKFTQQIIESLNKKRIDTDRLVRYCNNARQVQLKFVYSDDNSIKEIEDILDKMQPFIADDINTYVILMPEGQTNDQLQEKREKIAEICVEKGWCYTDRLQILIWGQKRNV